MVKPARHGRHIEIMQELLDKANIFGYLTTEDLIEVFPDVGGDGEHLDAVMLSLRRRGVDIIDQDEGISIQKGNMSPATDMDSYANLETILISDTIGMYMKEMAHVPLLSVEEEINLAKRIEAGRIAGQELDQKNGLNSQKYHQELKKEETDGLLARDHLIKANTRLVVSIAKRYMRRGVPFLDLIQEGNLGLMKAVEKFEHQRGFRFSTYATWWIRQTISRAIADQSRTIRIPVHMSDRIRHLYKKSRELEQKFGRVPKTEELAEAMTLPTKKVDWMLRVSQIPLSLESPVNKKDEEIELGMFVKDTITPSPIQCAYTKLLSEKIKEVLDTLPPREARILRLRFGLENGRTYTLEEVGCKYGLTRERIRQIQSRALRRLRHPRRTRKLRAYL